MTFEIEAAKPTSITMPPNAVRRHVSRDFSAAVCGAGAGPDSRDSAGGPGRDAGLHRFPPGVSREFLHVYHVGKEQLLTFTTTVVAVLATDLLVGIGIGIALKFVLHLWTGAPIGSLFWPNITISRDAQGTTSMQVKGSAVFSNWIGLKRRIENAFGETSSRSSSTYPKPTWLITRSCNGCTTCSTIWPRRAARWSSQDSTATRPFPKIRTRLASGPRGHTVDMEFLRGPCRGRATLFLRPGATGRRFSSRRSTRHRLTRQGLAGRRLSGG